MNGYERAGCHFVRVGNGVKVGSGVRLASVARAFAVDGLVVFGKHFLLELKLSVVN